MSVSSTISSHAVAVAGVAPNTMVRFQCSWATGSSATLGAHSFRSPALSPHVSSMRWRKASAASFDAPHW